MQKQILVLFEGWSVAREGLRYAHALAQRIRAELHLLLLLPSTEHADPAALIERGHLALDGYLEGIDDRAVPVARSVRVGDPWSEFCKFIATTDRFHMVVWASEAGLSNGRPASAHWASRIQGEVGCPVVTAHRRAR